MRWGGWLFYFWSGAFTSDWHSINRSQCASEVNQRCYWIVVIVVNIRTTKSLDVVDFTCREQYASWLFSMKCRYSFRIWRNLHYGWGGCSLSLSVVGLHSSFSLVALTVALVVDMSRSALACTKCPRYIKNNETNRAKKRTIFRMNAHEKRTKAKCTQIEMLSLFWAEAAMAGIRIITHAALHGTCKAYNICVHDRYVQDQGRCR